MVNSNPNNGNGNGSNNGNSQGEPEFEKTFEKLETIGDDTGLWIETDSEGSERIVYGEDVEDALREDDGEDSNGNNGSDRPNR